ncbi:TPM domain-containing protein [Qipengyuania sp. 483]
MGYLNEKQHTIVSDAVAQAELTTSGEIVTVLADRSDGYTDVALWWAVGASFTAMSLFAMIPETVLSVVDSFAGGWSSEWSQGQVLTVLLLIGLVTFLLMLALQLWQPLKFKLIPGPVTADRVRDAAVRHFKVGAERRTHGRTGVLLYLSMREHRAEIVADEPIAEMVHAEIWGEAMADMLAEVSRGRLAEGLAAGVRDVGKVLAENFPRADDDENELPDRLIEL